MENFPLYIKSTLDKILSDIAAIHEWEFFDLDGSYLEPNKVESDKTAVAWSLLSLSPEGRDPFYILQFEAGAKTSQDISQYESMKVVSALSSIFTPCSAFFIRDYTGVSQPTQNLGEIFVVAASSTPPEFDRASSYRCLHVEAKVQRFSNG